MGTSKVAGIFTAIILIFIIIMFIVQFTPTMETEISSANITNTTTSMFVDMIPWVIPVLAVAGVIVTAVGVFFAYRSRKG